MFTIEPGGITDVCVAIFVFSLFFAIACLVRLAVVFWRWSEEPTEDQDAAPRSAMTTH
jgi:hypothetical protein|nr:MAG TPA: hypothetical protein [Caudoviricetes sp.]